MSENMQWTVTRNFEQGIFTNYKAFMGYRCVNGELEIVPEQAEVVKHIFDLYLAGNTFAQIKKELEKQKIKTATGKEIWDVTTIQKMLKNEQYIGDALLQKTYTVDFLTKKRVSNNGIVPQYYMKGNHEAIIPKNLYMQVQEEMGRRSHIQGGKSGKKRVYSGQYALSTIIVCGHCGDIFRRIHWNNHGCKSIVRRQIAGGDNRSLKSAGSSP